MDECVANLLHLGDGGVPGLRGGGFHAVELALGQLGLLMQFGHFFLVLRAGVVLGYGVTAVYAIMQGWPTVVPLWVIIGGLLATLLIGGVAGLYPAIRAARVAPTEALAAG